MDREILYRGKRMDGHGWVEGGIVPRANGQIFIAPIIDASQIIIYAVDPATVGQYTGLNDRNGKRIFEGDIVEGADFNCEDDGYGIVEWHDGAFEINNVQLTGTFHDNYYGTEFEVVGNIYDNPELME